MFGEGDVDSFVVFGRQVSLSSMARRIAVLPVGRSNLLTDLRTPTPIIRNYSTNYRIAGPNYHFLGR